jgi:hypothetical protein
VETSSFELTYKIDIKNDKNTIYKKIDGRKVDDIEGIAIWYINHAPVEKDLSTSFGYKPDFNGIGLFVFKHQNKWRMLSIYNQGLQGLNVETAVNNLSKYCQLI